MRNRQSVATSPDVEPIISKTTRHGDATGKVHGCHDWDPTKDRLTVETHLTGTIAGIFTRTVVANGHMNNHCVGLRLKLHLRDGSNHLFIRVKATTRDQTKPCKAKATNDKCDKKKQNDANINKHMGDESRSQHCGCNQSKWGMQQSKVK